jgi:hypothetical protein
MFKVLKKLKEKFQNAPNPSNLPYVFPYLGFFINWIFSNNINKYRTDYATLILFVDNVNIGSFLLINWMTVTYLQVQIVSPGGREFIFLISCLALLLSGEIYIWRIFIKISIILLLYHLHKLLVWACQIRFFLTCGAFVSELCKQWFFFRSWKINIFIIYFFRRSILCGSKTIFL